MIVYIKCKKSKVTVKLNLKRPNPNYSSCHPVGRHLQFSVTITRNIPWVDFVLSTLRFGRLYYRMDKRLTSAVNLKSIFSLPFTLPYFIEQCRKF
jgi:hypothetical protein